MSAAASTCFTPGIERTAEAPNPARVLLKNRRRSRRDPSVPEEEETESSVRTRPSPLSGPNHTRTGPGGQEVDHDGLGDRLTPRVASGIGIAPISEQLRDCLSSLLRPLETPPSSAGPMWTSTSWNRSCRGPRSGSCGTCRPPPNRVVNYSFRPADKRAGVRPDCRPGLGRNRPHRRSRDIPTPSSSRSSKRASRVRPESCLRSLAAMSSGRCENPGARAAARSTRPRRRPGR